MKYRYLFVFLLSWLLVPAGLAQVGELYQQSREHAQAGQYGQAKELLQQIIREDPQHYDALFLQALVTAWEGEYYPSLRQLNLLVRQHGPTQEAMEAIVRINYWAGENTKALIAAEKGLSLYPESHTLMYLRARVLAAEKAYDEAIVGLEALLEKNPGHAEAKSLLSQLQVLRLKNAVGVEYTHSRFSNTFAPWHQLTLSYQRKLPSALLVGRLRYAHMFEQNGVQAEVDAYPEIDNKTYAYLNLGVSDNTIFPALRWGAELFRELPGQWEASAGMRGLYFEEVPVHIITGQVGHYISDYWLSSRAFLTTLKGRRHLTGLLTLRRYLQNEDHFFSLYLGDGATPLQVNSLAEIQRLEASWLGVDYQYPFRDRTWLLRSGLEIQQEVYPEVRSTDRFSFTLQLQKRF